jgi:hypothetical protein
VSSGGDSSHFNIATQSACCAWAMERKVGLAGSFDVLLLYVHVQLSQHSQHSELVSHVMHTLGCTCSSSFLLQQLGCWLVACSRVLQAVVFPSALKHAEPARPR